MSYVDVGDGSPIVFVHGSTTWSYLFRHLIKHLSKENRCISIDHLGFGLSEKAFELDFSYRSHGHRFFEFMEEMNLKNVTLVVHDAGAPIALSWAIKRPERVNKIVLFNSWMWSLRENKRAMRLAHLMGNPINRLYYRLLNASPSFILPAVFADRHRLPRPVQYQLLSPFTNFKEREGIYQMIIGFDRADEWFEQLWNEREALSEIPTLILWGEKDPMFGSDYLERWQTVFHDYHTQTFRETGRFVPEEAPKKVIEAIRWFLSEADHAEIERA